MRACSALLLLCACGGAVPPLLAPPPDGGVAAVPDAGAPDGGAQAIGPSLAGCPVFPLDNAWNRDVSGDPIDPRSDDYLELMGAGTLKLQPGFGGPYGQPFLVVPASEPRVQMSFLYASQSEPGPYPFPPDLPVTPDEDRHATVLVLEECKIYETFNTWASGSGFHADSGAVFDLWTGAPRPDGWTSATASGLPILPGLVRYDEAVEKGEIRHALSLVAGATAHAYLAPGTHSSGTTDAQFAPPMALRVRLRASYDLSRFHGASLVVLRALQKYGMFVSDSGSGQFWVINGAYDGRSSIEDLDQLKTVPASAFEVVKLGTVHSGQ